MGSKRQVCFTPRLGIPKGDTGGACVAMGVTSSKRRRMQSLQWNPTYYAGQRAAPPRRERGETAAAAWDTGNGEAAALASPPPPADALNHVTEDSPPPPERTSSLNVNRNQMGFHLDDLSLLPNPQPQPACRHPPLFNIGKYRLSSSEEGP